MNNSNFNFARCGLHKLDQAVAKYLNESSAIPNARRCAYPMNGANARSDGYIARGLLGSTDADRFA
jgi:hypothetical protein